MTRGPSKSARWTVCALFCALASCSAAFSQPPMGGTTSRFELSEGVQLERADSAAQTYLNRVKAYLADKHWNEAVDTLLEIMESSGGRLLAVTDHRLVSVDRYCQLQLTSLPPDALAIYRRRVDPLAEKWCKQGIARRDRGLLLDVVNQMLASSWGDDALMAIGEIALERADFASARAYWEKAIPVEQPADGPRTWLSVPDTNLDLAAIRARLVLVSILEGSRDRAADELEQMARLHPDARGRLGGQEGNYVQLLHDLLAESAAWPPLPRSDDWPTFAGTPQRNGTCPRSIDPAGVAWRLSLRKSMAVDSSARSSDVPHRHVAEDANLPLSYYPVVVGNLVLLCNQVEVLAIDLKTGKPAWGLDNPAIYRDQYDEAVHIFHNPADSVGAPRFTMTVHQGRAYARMGSSVTSWPRDDTKQSRAGYLVCLDLNAEGRLVWKTTPEDDGFAFEGSPIVDGGRVYVGMRRSDIQPQAWVACYDAEDGRQLWRQYVCASETPARGMLHEMTHNLLTLNGDTLYYNTNLGAVASLATSDGRLKWVSLYPRDRRGDLFKPAPHWSRELTPCLFDRGRLLVAPADSQQIFALDAETGQILWQTGPEVDDVVHLLGVAGHTLIASGYKLYWIGLDGPNRGKVEHVWPDAQDRLGYGRGIIAGGLVWWPTRETIFLFDQATAQLKKQIPLVPRGLTGGNLLVADDRLLISTGDELIALGTRPSESTKEPTGVATRNGKSPSPLRQPLGQHDANLRGDAASIDLSQLHN